MGLTSVRAGAPTACRMCFIVNTEHKMRTGKIAAQVAHACLSLYTELTSKSVNTNLHRQYRAWVATGQTKVVLQCRTTEELLELYRKVREKGVVCSLIQDAGRTQVEAGAYTVLGVFGDDTQLSMLTGHLKLL